MKESKESYYDILNLNQNCTTQDIKKAYISLCKDYHPDKLPPSTPEGARKFIAGRMSLINEAYSILKDINTRSQYDLELKFSENDVNHTHNESHSKHSNNYQKTHENSYSNMSDDPLESSILENALLELELDKKKFDSQLKSDITSIERKYAKHLKTIKSHIPGNLDVVDASMKLEKSLIYGFFTFIGLWLIPLGAFMSFNGWIIILVFGFLFIRLRSIPTYQSSYVKEVREAKVKRDTNVYQFDSEINEKINHFKNIPIYSINQDFIRSLSPRDRLLLVKALKQRDDTDKADQAVQSTVKVVAAIGLFAIFLGAIGG